MSDIVGLPRFLQDREGKVRKKRAWLSATFLIFAILPFVLGLFGIDLLQELFLRIGEEAIPSAPGWEKLPPPFPQIIGSVKSAASYVIYLFVVFLISGLHVASWLRDDLKEDLSARIGLLTEETIAAITTKLQKLDDLDRTVESISSNAKNLDKRFDGINSRLLEIGSNLRRKTEFRTVKMAIFDHLLIYTPLFVANIVGFFEEEGLKVEFVPVGNDEKVACQVVGGDYEFGACDPFFAIRSLASMPAAPDLLVVMPLCKRFGFSVLGTDAAIRKIEAGEAIRIASYQAESTTFLAATAFRDWLVEEHAQVDTGTGDLFKILELDANGSDFQKQASLRKAMKKWDFVVLWEPQTSWAIGTRDSEFGFVGIPTQQGSSSPLPRIFKDCRPRGESGFLDEKEEWKVWTPNSTQSEDGHKCLVSACVVGRSLLERDPDLVRRVTRALAHASVFLHALDWHDDNALAKGLFEKLQGVVRSGNDVRIETLRSMVGDKAGGLFPFVPSANEYSPDRYFGQLQACHELWSRVEHLQSVPFRTKEDYRGFFVNRTQLEANP